MKVKHKPFKSKLDECDHNECDHVCQMKTTYTPGPWTIQFEASELAMNGVGQYSVHGPKGIICNTEESSIEETKGNACLIAASPDLLEVCKKAVYFFDALQGPYSDMKRDFIDAIDKAEGRKS